MAELNVTMKKILEGRRIKVEKVKIIVLNFLCKITTNCKFLSQKLSDHENEVFILIYDIFPKI